ncbi:MAG: malto-oligosyltrehalose trehalohydrolase [Deltaproteobacteria bacterium]|nr:malto-oligosyltrehalose trehalohydrolase [Deltaproteobacteria bacterium]
MGTFRVWAPAARETVELDVGGHRVPMTRAGGGWWTADVPEGGQELEYAFRVDGGKALPDPRSPWQPRGVHGPSRIPDPAFAWTDGAWQPPPLACAVVYELHVGTFTPEGTFEALIGRLDYLKGLGVTHVELMPVNEFPGSFGWGYDGVDLFAPHHAYGGPSGLNRLVDACHARGLAVLLDVVYNHFGPEGNYLPRFGPYLNADCRTAWGEAVNLDGAGSDEVRRFFCDNARQWLRDYHFDGLRLDAVHAYFDRSAVHLLEELGATVRGLENELGRHLVLIAESDLNDPRVLRAPGAGGYGVDAQWSDDFHHALHALLTGDRTGYYADFGRLEHLAKALSNAFVYDGIRSQYRGRRHGRKPAGLAGSRFLGYLQTHDQVGNRATGDRIGHLTSPDRQKVGAALVLTSPFVPMLFQGEEWAASSPFLYFADHEDPALRAAVAEGRRSEFASFGWDPESIPDPGARETFERSKLRWEELGLEPHASMLEWYRSLVRLRHREPALRDGRLEEVDVRYSEEERWIAVGRGPFTVLANLSERARSLPLAPDRPRNILLRSRSDAHVGETSAELPPESVLLLGPAS